MQKSVSIISYNVYPKAWFFKKICRRLKINFLYIINFHLLIILVRGVIIHLIQIASCVIDFFNYA